MAAEFEPRIRAWEDEHLSAAGHPLLPGDARAAGGGLLAAHALPARPRPDRALQGLPAPQAQDAGVRRARGRPLPHPAHPHARGHADLANRGAGAAPERGPRRGDRAGPRPRPPAVRPHRRGGARRVPARALRARLPPLRALAAGGGRARADGGPQPHRAGARRDPPPLRPRRRAGDARGRGSCGSSTASPTSTTTSTTRCARACSRRPTCRRARSRSSATRGSRRIDTLVHDLVEHSERAGEIVQGEEVGGAMARLRDVHVRARLPRARRRAREHERIETRDARAVRPLRRARPRPAAACEGASVAERVTDYIAGMTDRFCIREFEALAVPRAFASLAQLSGPLHARLQGAGPRRGRHGRPRVGAHRAAAGRRQPLRGAVPVPRGAHPVVRDRSRRRRSTTASAAGPAATCSRSCRRPRGWTSSARWSAGRPLRDRARARGGGSREAAARRGRASGCSSCSSARRRSTRGICGSPPRRRGAREYLAGRGLERGDAARVPRRLRAERVGPACWRLAPGRLHRSARSMTPGWRSAPSEGRRLYDRFRAPDHVPAAPTPRARAGLRGAAHARGPAAEVPQHVRGRAVPQGPQLFGARPRAGARRRGRGGRAGRGLHGRARPAPGGARATRSG